MKKCGLIWNILIRYNNNDSIYTAHLSGRRHLLPFVAYVVYALISPEKANLMKEG